jgi:hypothetical protein
MSAPITETFVREIEKNNEDIIKIHQLEIGAKEIHCKNICSFANQTSNFM